MKLIVDPSASPLTAKTFDAHYYLAVDSCGYHTCVFALCKGFGWVSLDCHPTFLHINAQPDCFDKIVADYGSFRLYHAGASAFSLESAVSWATAIPEYHFLQFNCRDVALSALVELAGLDYADAAHLMHGVAKVSRSTLGDVGSFLCSKMLPQTFRSEV